MRKFVVCLDTLGQDREFTEEQRVFALETVKNFAQIWEKREQENLTKDRNLRLQMIDSDKEYNDSLLAKLTEDEDEYVRDHIQMIVAPPQSSINQPDESSGEQQPPSRAQTPALTHPYQKMDEEQKDFYQKTLRLRYQAQQFKNIDQLKHGIQLFLDFTVIKFPRVWQSLFYLLKINRETICEPETNKLKWKIAKKLLKPEARLFD